MRFARILFIVGAFAAFAGFAAPNASAVSFTDESFFTARGVVGEPYTHWIRGYGGCGPTLPYQFRALDGNLPPGLTLRLDGLISGTPTQAGSWTFYVEIRDQDPPSATWCIVKRSEHPFTIHVSPALVMTPAAAPGATVGTPYNVVFGVGGAATWSLVSGQLPPGLTFNSLLATIAGTPSVAGNYTFTIRGTVADGRTKTQQYTIAVRERLTLAAPTVPAAEVGVPLPVLRATAAGGSGTNTWKLEGTLPRGVSFDAATGTVAGTPAAAGTFALTLSVTDSEGRTASTPFSLVVSPRLAIATTRLVAARTGRAYVAAVKTKGGVGVVTYKVISGRFPVGIRLNARTGKLTGRARSAGTFRITIQARDALGVTATRRFVLRVRAAAA